MNIENYIQQDATGLAELVRKGETSAAELASLAQRICEQVNPDINAVIEWFDTPDANAGTNPDASDAPFAGVPFLIKDLVLHTAHAPCEMGSRLAEGVRIPHDTDLMQRFRAAGLVTLGRTTVPEFGYCPTTESVFNGPTRNPWDLGRSAGGSSGGSGAAVAAGIVPMAHANDGGGSIRIPASCCGLVGVKPTRGRIPTGPDYHDPLCGMGIEFAVTRSVRDAAALLDAVHGPGLGDGYVIPPPQRPWAVEAAAGTRPLKIAWTGQRYDGSRISDDVLAGLEHTVRLCRGLGHELVEAAPRFDFGAFLEATHVIWAAFVAHGVEGVAAMTGRKPSPDNLEATTLQCWEDGRRMSAQDLLSALDVNNVISRQVAGFFQEVDVLLTPTISELPLPLGRMNANDPTLSAREWTAQVFTYAAFTGLFNTTGQPAISLPLHRGANDLPVGMQFVGRWGDEATLFRLAGQLEQAAPWPATAGLFQP